MFEGIIEYLKKAFSGLKPIVAIIGSLISCVMFPDRTLFLAFIAVIAAAAMDIVTKMYALSKTNGGYFNATKMGKIYSGKLWAGTKVKIFSYTIISILTGLSYRVMFLKEVGLALGTFVYSVMFLREFQSNVENLCEAGADLKWLLIFSKNRNKEILKQYDALEEKSDDSNGRI